MARIAVYSSKGGVGKTTIAVNLAWAAATLSSRRTLLWDLDAQGAASFILRPNRSGGDEARAVIERDLAPRKLIVPTPVPNLDLLPADASLRTLDLLFAEIDSKKRLLRISEALDKNYDRIIIDCPPGLGVTADQIIRGASLIVLPVIPSTLSSRAAGELIEHLGGRKGAPPVVPVFNLVDRRRLAHRTALAAAPDQHVLPMASMVEQMADRHAPVGTYAGRSPVTGVISALWRDIERRVAAD
ncbi:ParA family protein [Sphingomonas sp.]|uniref:ParA family protein n=1 Tax=Sphingomonas sp. TaxID=28214 RepID=UPI003B3B57E9